MMYYEQFESYAQAPQAATSIKISVTTTDGMNMIFYAPNAQEVFHDIMKNVREATSGVDGEPLMLWDKERGGGVTVIPARRIRYVRVSFVA